MTVDLALLIGFVSGLVGGLAVATWLLENGYASLNALHYWKKRTEWRENKPK